MKTLPMSAMRCRPSTNQHTTAGGNSHWTAVRCTCFTASDKAGRSARRHISGLQRSTSASWVCRSAILPSQQLQQALDLQQPQRHHTQAYFRVRNRTIAAADQYNTLSAQQQQLTELPNPKAHRRDVVVALPALGSLLLGLGSLQLAQPAPAAASKLGAAADSAWEAIGGGPADLTFPESWLGVWDVTSTLVSVELPLGKDVVPNIASVQRAEQQDLQKPLRYQVAFMRNKSGRVVYDRRFNTAALLAAYYGSNMDFAGRINWNPQDPNALSLTMPGGLSVTTRVLRRSEEDIASDRFETSEFMQQVFETDDPARPRVKASQCFTKYKFRDEAAAEAAGGPAIVATQVVSDYLTPFDGEQNYLSAANKPITTYTYKMAFTRHHEAAHVASAMVLS